MVHRRGDRWTGRLVNAKGLDQPRIAFPLDQAPYMHELGAQVELGLAARKMAKAVRCGALMIAVEWTGTGIEITYDPDEPELFAEAIPGLAQDGDDRRSQIRVFPRSGDGIQVPVKVQEDLGGRPLVARLCDASAGGLGLLFPYSLEERLCFARVLLCEIAIAGGTRREVPCRVRNRTLLEDGVRYGVEFSTENGDPPPQPFEPLWDCTCGEIGLLAATHLRCPRCGRPRSATTRVPHRDGLLSTVSHPFVGTALTCRSCGSQWSADAKFCARCGLGLG